MMIGTVVEKSYKKKLKIMKINGLNRMIIDE